MAVEISGEVTNFHQLSNCLRCCKRNGGTFQWTSCRTLSTVCLTGGCCYNSNPPPQHHQTNMSEVPNYFLEASIDIYKTCKRTMISWAFVPKTDSKNVWQVNDLFNVDILNPEIIHRILRGRGKTGSYTWKSSKCRKHPLDFILPLKIDPTVTRSQGKHATYWLHYWDWMKTTNSQTDNLTYKGTGLFSQFWISHHFNFEPSSSNW